MGEKPDNITIKQCQCGICDRLYNNKSAVKVAQLLAKHWNKEHYNEFTSEQPFDEYIKDSYHVKGNKYTIEKQKLYVTAYDMLATQSDSRIFKYSYTRNVKVPDVCIDCNTNLEKHNEEEYHKIRENQEECDLHICSDCKQKREIQKRKERNHSLFEFTAVSR